MLPILVFRGPPVAAAGKKMLRSRGCVVEFRRARVFVYVFLPSNNLSQGSSVCCWSFLCSPKITIQAPNSGVCCVTGHPPASQCDRSRSSRVSTWMSSSRLKAATHSSSQYRLQHTGRRVSYHETPGSRVQVLRLNDLYGKIVYRVNESFTLTPPDH